MSRRNARPIYRRVATLDGPWPYVDSGQSPAEWSAIEAAMARCAPRQGRGPVAKGNVPARTPRHRSRQRRGPHGATFHELVGRLRSALWVDDRQLVARLERDIDSHVDRWEAEPDQ